MHHILVNEAYTGTLIWGISAKDGAPPVRVEDAFPAIVTREQFARVGQMLRDKAPAVAHPRRVASSHLLSGLVKCQGCGKALTVKGAKSGQYHYYVCVTLNQRGSGACEAPRLNSKAFERLIIDQIREHILTESNIRELVRLVDEEMDGVAHEERRKLKAIEKELADVRRRTDRLWQAVETSDIKVDDILPRLRKHQDHQERLERAAEKARTPLEERRLMLDSLDTVTAYVRVMSDWLRTSDLTASKAFIRSFVKEIVVKPGAAIIRYTIPPPDSPFSGGDPIGGRDPTRGGGPIGGGDPAELSLGDSVLPTVQSGGGEGTRTPDLGIANAALSQLSYAPTKSEYETPTRERQTTRAAPRAEGNAAAQPSSSPGSSSIRIRPAAGSISRITSGMAGISRSRAPSRRTR